MWFGKLALVGNFAYQSMGMYGLLIVDISNPSMPVAVQTNQVVGYISGIAVSGNYVYVTSGCAGTKVLDVSDPLNPVLKREIPGLAYQFYDVAVVGSRLYLAGAVNNCQFGSAVAGEFWIMSISSPATPVLLASVHFNQEALKVAVEEPYALVAVYGSGVNIFDVTNPVEPKKVGTFGVRYPYDLVVSNRLAYLGDDTERFRIVDFQTPAHPVELLSTNMSAEVIILHSNDVYIASQEGFEARPLANFDLPLGGYETTGQCLGISIDGSNAYLSNSKKGLQILDVTNPSQPRIIGQSDDCKSTISSWITNNVAYVADGTNGLVVLDVKDPGHPVKLGRLSSPYARDIALDGNVAYVSSQGLEIVDISDPSQPNRLNYMAYTAYAGGTYELALQGHYVYLTAGRGGLRIIDVSDPTNPQLTIAFTITQWDNAHSIALTDHYAFVADDGINIIDIEDPRNPVRIGSLGSGSYDRVAIWGRYGLAASGTRLAVFDHSDPAHPQIVARYSPLLNVHAIAASGHYAWLANGDGGLYVLGLDKPGIAAPAELTLARDGDMLQCTVLGQPGRTHVLQEAGQLSTPPEWIDVLTNNPASGILEVTRPVEQGGDPRFFRVVSE